MIKTAEVPNKRLSAQSFCPRGFITPRTDLVLSTLVINFLSLALPIMTLQVYDRILPSPGSGTLPVLITGVCLAIFLETCLRLSRAYIMGRSGATYEHLMGCQAMNRVIHARLTGLGSTGVGEFLHRIGAVNKIKEFYSGYALTVYVDLAFIGLYFGLIIYISGYLAAVPAAILGGFLLVSIVQGQKLKTALFQRETADDQRYNALIEILEGVHSIKAFALEKDFARRYESLEENSCQRNYNVTQSTSSTFNAGAVFANLMVVSVISFGAVAVLNGNLTTGGLIAVLLLSGRMMQPVQKGLGLWTRYQDYLLARSQLESVLTIPVMKTADPKTFETPHSSGHVELENIGFTLDGKTLFEGVNLAIEPGECVLIAGAHASGKTSLMKLIGGVYAADTGRVLLDGCDILEYPETARVQHSGFIATEPAIFRETIRENITSFGLVAEPDAREVANLFQVDRDVARLPSGFDTILTGTETDSIPPGLKQRIAMVRALAAKPRLILFDNADRALDKNGYDLVFSILARLKGRATLVISSNDKNIQTLADRTLFIQSPSVREVMNMPQQHILSPYQELKL